MKPIIASQHRYLIWLSALLVLIGLICLWLARGYASDAGYVVRSSSGQPGGESAGWSLARELAKESNSGAASGFAVAGGLSLLAAAVAGFGAARVADLSLLTEQTLRIRELEARLRDTDAAVLGLRDAGAAQPGAAPDPAGMQAFRGP